MKANLFEMPVGETTPDHQLVAEQTSSANQSHHLVIINQLLYHTVWRKNIMQVAQQHQLIYYGLVCSKAAFFLDDCYDCCELWNVSRFIQMNPSLQQPP